MTLSILINPFDKQTDNRLIVSAIVISVFGILMATWFNTRFDGVLDVHFTEKVSVAQAGFDFAINTVVLAVLLYIAALFINKRTRPLDILLPILIARLPYYILPVFNLNDAMYLAGEKMLASVQEGAFPVIGDDMALITIFTIASITMMIWFAILLYNGFRVATNSKGPKGIVLAMIAILAAEVITKIIFLTIPTQL